MTDPGPAHDMSAVTIVTPPPAEPYTDREREVLDRIAAGENPLGWQLAGRDARGDLVWTADVDGGRKGHRRRAIIVLTSAGQCHGTVPCP